MTRTGSPPRALVAVEPGRNGELLREVLADGHGFAVAGTEDAKPPVDLAVVDAASLPGSRPLLEELRAGERPAWLPVLLIVPGRSAGSLTREAWRLADEVLPTPVRRSELDVRIRRLRALRERSVEVARRLDDLDRSNVDLEQFAYVAAHELATPLGVVTGAVATIAARHRDSLDPAVLPLLDAAEAEGARLQTLIADLLAFSRAESSSPRLPVPLGEVAGEAVATLEPQLRATGGRVEVEPLPTVLGDRRQLRIVFGNLVGNALKYRAPGRAPVVEVTAADAGGRVVVSVADNGLGVSGDRVTAIFDMFERSDDGRAASHGIGLALCRRILERHDGSIWVEPAPGAGSVFRFSLPKS